MHQNISQSHRILDNIIKIAKQFTDILIFAVEEGVDDVFDW